MGGARRPRLAAFVLVCAGAAAGCQLLAGTGLDPGGLGIPGGGTGSPGNGATPTGAVEGATSAPVQPGFTLPPDAGSGGAPTAIAAYRGGRAIIVLGDGTRLVLDRINRGPHVYQQFGSQVRWSNASGWYVMVSGAGAEADMGAPYVILDHIVAGQHFTTDDPAACSVAIESATPQQLRGSATCRSLHWTDATDIGIDGAHRDAGLPAFSADITFEAVS